MNKYEEHSRQRRKSAMRSSMSLWSAGLALLMVGLLIVGFRESAPPEFFYKAAAVFAILMLLFRQISKRLKANAPKSAQPDPKSTLKLS